MFNIFLYSEKHKNFIRRFGLAEDSGFPSLGFIPGYRSQDEDLVWTMIYNAINELLLLGMKL